MKNWLKTFATAWSSEIIFSETISYWPSWETIFFSISVILDFVFILSVKNGLTIFQNVSLSVMSLVLILLTFFFSLLIKLTQKLRCLLYAFLNLYSQFYLVLGTKYSVLFHKVFAINDWLLVGQTFYLYSCLFQLC